MRNIRTVSLILSIVLATGSAYAQQTTRDKGIDLYNQGKHGEAASVLEKAVTQKEFEGDAQAWNYLGLAFLRNGDTKKALKALKKSVELAPANNDYRLNLAFAYIRLGDTKEARKEAERAIKADPKNASAYLLRGSANWAERKLEEAFEDSEKVISLNPSYAGAYILKSNVMIARMGKRMQSGSNIVNELAFLKQVIDLLQTGEKKSQGDQGLGALKDELEGLNEFYRFFTKDKKPNIDINTSPTDPDVKRLKIIKKPRPEYTDEARRLYIQGYIKIAVLFSAAGDIRHVLVLEGLGFGLDENAVKAARRIQFEPEMKNGKPVPTVKVISYGFSIG